MPIVNPSILRLLRLLCCLALAGLPLTGCEQAGEKPVLKIGYMNCNNEQETQARFRPLTRYLSEKVGVEFVAVPVDTQDF
jgi:phosphonate transport system substrate-binding protein